MVIFHCHVSFLGCKWVDGLQCIAYMFLFKPKILINPVLIIISFPSIVFLQMRDSTQTFQWARTSCKSFQLSPLIEITPWKINGWNLQPSPMNIKENHLNQTSMIMFQPLIFQGVVKMGSFLK